MSFAEQLTSIVSSVEGAIACSVMGFDGIAVETVQAPALAQQAADLEVTSAWVEYGNVLGQLKAGTEGLKAGTVSELTVNTDKLITLMRLVTPEYFLVLGLLPSGNLGKGRYVLRITGPKLASEL